MRNIKRFSLVLCLISVIAPFLKLNAQINKCGTDEIHRQLLLSDPAYAQRMQSYEDYVATIQPSLQKTMGVVYKMPVVVHVMHKGEAIGTGINVSDQAIRDAIQDLNEMYRKVPGTAGDGNGVDVEIEYSLAVRDPAGNCTNGIVRVNMTGNSAYMSNGVDRSSSGGISDASLKAISVWNQTKYYNIWLISEIDNNNGGSGVQGYAYFASSHGSSVDGAVILSSNFISGTSTTAAHELGHSLNLYHTFEGDGTGSTCPAASNGCGSGAGDCCGDIPAHIRSPYDCATGINACDGTTQRDLFIHNYMDYSDDLCQNMLTANQKTRMVAAVTGVRASFLSPENGGTNLSLVPPTTAVVDFKASASVICGTGQTVDFMDMSSCTPNSYIPASSYSGITHSWVFTNGTNTYTSSAQNPSITFTNTGTYTVSLSITNASGTTSLTKPGMLIITSGAPVAGCTPGTTNAGNYWQTIYKTSFNTFSSSTSQYVNSAYSNLACSYNTTVNAGGTYSLSVSANAAGGSGNEVFEVYIDYNNNGVFANPSELVFSGVATSSTTSTFTTNVTIPGTAVQNTLLRMRVIGETGTLSVSERTCGVNLFIGDVEDYGVFINPPACASPSITSSTGATRCGTGTLTLSATTNSGTVNWYTAATGGTAIATGTVYTTPSLTATTIYYVDATSAGCTTPSRTAITASISAGPTVTISPSATSLCSGQSVTLTVSGATTYTWAPTGSGTVSVVSPTATTIYTVTGTTAGCTGPPKTATVSISSASSLPLVEDFQGTFPPANWFIVDAGNDNVKWSKALNAGALTTTNSAVFDNFNVDVTGTRDELKTTVNLSGFSSAKMTFYRAYGQTFTTPNIDSLEIRISTNCGSSSTQAYYKGGSQIATGNGNGTTIFVPTAAQWAKDSIDLTPYVGQSSVIVSLINRSNYGDGLYIDKINLTGIAATTPTAAITSASTGCTGTSITLTDASIGNPSSWAWTMAGGTPSVSTSQNTSVTYSTAGVKTITLTVANASGTTTATKSITITATPTVAASITNTTICSGTSVVETLTGATTYTWLPSGSGSTSTLTPASTTVYTITGSTGGCTSAPRTVTVNVTPTPTVNITASSSTICSGQTVTLTASGGTTYSWAPGAQTTTVIAVSPTVTASYTVTGFNGSCSSTKTITINVTSTPTVATSITNTTICSGSSIVATVTGATTYTWLPSGSGGTSTLTPASTTVYTVTGSTGGCASSAKTFTVNVINTPTVGISVSSSTICPGQTTTLTASGASTYSWSPGAQTTTVIAVSPTVTASYTVTGFNGSCSSTKTITINVTSTPTVASSITNTTVCSGSSVVATLTGATTYTWLPSGSGGTSTLTPSSTTVYTVTGSTGSCASAPKTFTVNVTTTPTVGLTTSSSTICAGQSVTLTASGASTYSWSPGAQTTTVITVNPTGTSSYTVRGFNGSCSSTKTITINVSSTPTVVSSITNTTICNGKSVIATVTGATSYSWFPTGSGNTSTLTPSSTTVYTVTGRNGSCVSAPKTFTINVNANPTLSNTVTSVSCFGLCDGSMTVTASGGTGPYAYSLVQGAPVCAATTCTNLCAGVYTLNVTDMNGCTATSNVLISQPTQLMATISNTNATCAGCTDGAASVLASGGTPGYSYTWLPGSQTTPSIANLAVGCYTAQVFDNNGCVVTATTCISFGTSVAQLQNTGSSLSIFPNPGKGVFTISNTIKTAQFDVVIINALGQTVMTESGENISEIAFDLSTYSRGIYYAKVTTTEGTKLFKIVLE
ncbi:MAG: hypothetical protein K0S53_2269 [Bacteroidetes bacterium]|jgi:PKD repeat protein|nr:hypothetical protein [Bacteroidota bacterium]MDF2452036.1 hypothetical protein [Bacteroidota bacterium]